MTWTSLFEKYKIRGLDTSRKEGFPVHQGPVDQASGMRVFYLTDADGNRLGFGRSPALNSRKNGGKFPVVTCSETRF